MSEANSMRSLLKVVPALLDFNCECMKSYEADLNDWLRLQSNKDLPIELFQRLDTLVQISQDLSAVGNSIGSLEYSSTIEAEETISSLVCQNAKLDVVKRIVLGVLNSPGVVIEADSIISGEVLFF